MENEFSVYWWDRDGGQHRELQFVDVDTALKATRRLCCGPAAALGVVKKVMITDGGDHCNFLWEDGRLIYPTNEMRKAAMSKPSTDGDNA